MIEFTQGNLLEADVETLVNIVNTVGVMGKSVALMFKEAFLEDHLLYRGGMPNLERQGWTSVRNRARRFRERPEVDY